MTALIDALGQALDLPEDDLHRTVDHPLLEPLAEDQLERTDQVQAGTPRGTRREA